MWKVIAIFILAIPLAVAFENIRKEVHKMRVQKGKAQEVDEKKQEEEKFDNWYMGNEKLMQEAEEKKQNKKLAKIQKKEAKTAKKKAKQKQQNKEFENVM